jgi:predicted metal-dependent hydrolase
MSTTTEISQDLPHDHIDGHPIEVRRPRFDWDGRPAHWIPGDPMASHVGNALHLLFPTGERFFMEAVRDASEQVTDPALQSAIKEFIKQEAWHAQAHDQVLRHLDDIGIDPGGYLERLEKFFDIVLRDRPSWPDWTRGFQIRRRLAITAALEHFTAVLGHWALTADGLDEADADPTMLDLFRWHAAEEVEHRALVFDVYQHVGGGYALRAVAMVGTTVGLLAEWALGVRYFIRHDPAIAPDQRPGVRDYLRAARRGRVPSVPMLLRSVPRYLRRDHHPRDEADSALALEYLRRSPAVKAAA